MNIAYSIMSVDDSRKAWKGELRNVIEYPELINKIVYYDTRRDEEYLEALKRFERFQWHWKNPRRGHFGVFVSTLSAWEYIAKSPYDGVIVFEDDATVHKDFHFLMNKYLPQLPEDWDFFSIHNPHNQNNDYLFEYDYLPDGSLNGHKHYPNGAPYYDIGSLDLCRSFQGYGACAIMYSPKGAARLLNFFEQIGIYQSADCAIFQASKATYPLKINGYSVKPARTKPANVHLEAPTQIHNTEMIVNIDEDINAR